MGKAIVIGIIIILSIIAAFGAERYLRKGELNGLRVFMTCMYILLAVLIFGGIWYF